MQKLKQFAATASVLVLLTLPALGYAQQDLRATIEAAIRSDPRSAGMSNEQIDALIDGLTEESVRRGVSQEDILWRPQGEMASSSVHVACVIPQIFCSINHAFGFDGSDYTIPIWLGAIALMLIFLIAGLLEHHHIHVMRMRALAHGPPAPPRVQ